jgi:cytochrome bd-type quinol oxidase subunit 2
MSSPGARQRRRREQYQAPRSRRELAIAIAASVFIVGTTAFMIWMLRPGGIADRQPRSTWLFALAFFAVVIACYVILRPSSRLKADRRVSLAVALGAIVVVTAVAGIFWPHGLLRHTPTIATTPTTPTTPTSPAATNPTTPSTPTTPTTPGSTGATTSSAPTTTSTIP